MLSRTFFTPLISLRCEDDSAILILTSCLIIRTLCPEELNSTGVLGVDQPLPCQTVQIRVCFAVIRIAVCNFLFDIIIVFDKQNLRRGQADKPYTKFGRAEPGR